MSDLLHFKGGITTENFPAAAAKAAQSVKREPRPLTLDGDLPRLKDALAQLKERVEFNRRIAQALAPDLADFQKKRTETRAQIKVCEARPAGYAKDSRLAKLDRDADNWDYQCRVVSERIERCEKIAEHTQKLVDEFPKENKGFEELLASEKALAI